MLIIDDFSSRLSNLISGIERDDRPEGLLFHYRKPGQRSENIVKNNELLFTAYESLPDKYEVILTHAHIIRLISKRDLDHPFWHQVFNFFLNISDNVSFYTLSLSDARDDLYLWQEYGGSNKGISFGFDFKTMPLPENNQSNVKYLLKVIYQKDINTFDMRVNALLDLANSFIDQISEVNLLEYSSILVTNLVSFLPILKQDQYALEKEYRLVIPGIINHSTRIRYPFPLDINLFRGEKNSESHYADVLERNVLREILIGSQADICYEQKMLDLLESYKDMKQNINISRSNV